VGSPYVKDPGLFGVCTGWRIVQECVKLRQLPKKAKMQFLKILFFEF